MDKVGEYKVETFPLSRISIIDVGSASLKKHHIKALIELDVTKPRKLIKQNIDGAPAVRALSKLTKLVESGYGL